MARLTVEPLVGAAQTIRAFSRGMVGEVGIMDSIAALRAATDQLATPGNAAIEEALWAQAKALDAIFTEMARRAALNMSDYPEAFDRYMRHAMKAQAQARATYETIAEVRSPPVVIARQANIAAGPQQVNNAPPAAQRALAREVSGENLPNELKVEP